MQTQKQKVIAVALIRNAQGKILVQKRIDPQVPKAHGKWEFPGGLVEFGETPEQAAVRECKEETNCTIEIIRMLPFCHTKIWQRADGIALQVFVWFFEAYHKDGEPKPLDKKVSEVMWRTKEEALRLDSLPGLKESLKYIE
jgi:mutator protein MutT